MSTDIIQPFDFKGHQVRTLTFETGQTWWVLADVAKVLGVQNASDLAKRLDQDERSRFNLGRQGEGWIANEARTARLVFGFIALHNSLRVLKYLMWRKTHGARQRSELGHLYLSLCSKHAVDGLYVHSCFLC